MTATSASPPLPTRPPRAVLDVAAAGVPTTPRREHDAVVDVERPSS